MANPRQRNKARSSTTKRHSTNSLRRLHQKSRRTKPMQGPKVLQEGWDKKKTVFQNYAALGLLSSLPLPGKASSSRVQLPYIPPSTGMDVETENENEIPSGFGRIVRDEEGNVIDIILADDDEDQAAGSEDEAVREVPRVEGKTEVAKALDELASLSAPVHRHTSSQELTWLRNLVRAHGDDTEAMAMDLKRNVWQKTRGELTRMIKKAGGVEKLSR